MRSATDLVAGQNTELPAAQTTLNLHTHGTPPDLVALLVGPDGRVSGDDDFVFYNHPSHPSACIELVGQSLTLDINLVPPAVDRIVVGVNADDHTQLGRLSVAVEGLDATLSFSPQQLGSLPTAVIIEIYRRSGTWRVRAVGQGWANGLRGLATSYGVEVDSSDGDFGAYIGEDGTREDELSDLISQRDALSGELALLRDKLREARASLVETDERMLLQQVGYYQFRHPLDDVVHSKKRLAELRSQVRTSITRRSAVHGTSEWMVNGSLREGQELVRQFADLMLRTYNVEADNCVRTVRAHSVPAAVKRLERTREAIARSGRTMGVSIDDAFHDLRLDELQLTADHHLRVEQEKEDARAERQQQREEARAQDEFRRRRKDLLKEETHYRGLLERSLRNGDADGEAVARDRLAEIAERVEEVDEMAANTRVGHVYVISNIGAFGDRVVKIGLTRREDPMQRVYELGSASVPFRFDVHALVFSKDAVALEAALHRWFEDRRVNRVNRRREFFRVSLEEVRIALEKVGGNHVVEFRSLPEAPEWRQSQVSSDDLSDRGVRLQRHEVVPADGRSS